MRSDLTLPWGTKRPWNSLAKQPESAACDARKLSLRADQFRVHGHLQHGRSRGFGVVGIITQLVDLWLDERRLPSYIRVVKTMR